MATSEEIADPIALSTLMRVSNLTTCGAMLHVRPTVAGQPRPTKARPAGRRVHKQRRVCRLMHHGGECAPPVCVCSGAAGGGQGGVGRGGAGGVAYERSVFEKTFSITSFG